MEVGEEEEEDHSDNEVRVEEKGKEKRKSQVLQAGQTTSNGGNSARRTDEAGSGSWLITRAL